jgi:hypothetical protein
VRWTQQVIKVAFGMKNRSAIWAKSDGLLGSLARIVDARSGV